MTGPRQQGGNLWGYGNTLVSCEWFANCENKTDRCVSHPILGSVPICHECAVKMEMDWLDRESYEDHEGKYQPSRYQIKVHGQPKER